MGKPIVTSIKAPESPLIVEFVGLPGAGKTTVLQQVAAQLKSENRSIVQRDEILTAWRRSSRLHRSLNLIPQTQVQWQVLLQSLRFATQVKPVNLQSFSKASKIFSNAKRLDAVCNGTFQSIKGAETGSNHLGTCQVILLDQGLLQETWSVGITGQPPATTALQSVLSTLVQSRSMAIVWFKIDIETALQRIQNRPTHNSRFDQMQLDAARSRLEQYAPFLEDIIACTQTLGVPLLEVDATQAVEEKTKNITHWITNQL